jgi:hypothetical protein
MRYDDIYGDRSERHQTIMTMCEDELHSEHPWTASLEFNELMLKKEIDEKEVPDGSCLLGTKKDGTTHRFVVANEQGEILPKLLFQKLVTIESGKAFGRDLTIITDDDQRDRCKCSLE